EREPRESIMFNNRPIRQKLLGAFILLSVVPWVLVAKFMLDYHITTLEQQSLNQLVSVRDIKRQQLHHYFQGLEKQARYFVGNADKGQMSIFSNPVLLALSEFSTGLSELAEDPVTAMKTLRSQFVASSGDTLQPGALRGYYLDAHNDLHPKFNAFIEDFSYTDLFLVNNRGDFVYSVKKDHLLGQNLLNIELTGSALTRAFVTAQREGNKLPLDTRPQAYFTDFATDANSGLDSAFVSVPQFDQGDFSAVIIYQLSKDGLNDIMAQHGGLGTTGETFLVGPDNRLRSAVQQRDFKLNPDRVLSTQPVNNALQGLKSQGLAQSYSDQQVLNAAMGVKVFNQTWALVTQITTAQAY
ncbi:MAG: hypothetical protein MJK04_06645, partial [Psychrosphaera sp.]|nr:hypothetical protein [Psychrosphaera sp.]